MVSSKDGEWALSFVYFGIFSFTLCRKYWHLCIATHYKNESEILAFINYINTRLAHDADVKSFLPISTVDEGKSFFSSLKSGILPCKLVNFAVPGTIDENMIVKRPRATAQMLENQQRFLDGAKKIGVIVTNIGGQDILDGVPHLICGLVWQIIKVCYNFIPSHI